MRQTAQGHTKGPRALVDLDFLGELARHDGLFALETYTELLLLYDNSELSPAGALGHRDLYVDICELLPPLVRQC